MAATDPGELQNRFGLQMHDHGCDPVIPRSAAEIDERLSDAASWAPLAERDAYADGLLAWAETVDHGTYARYRSRVFRAEIERHAREWAEAFPDETAELGAAKLEALLVAITDQHGRPDGESYEAWFGPGIPTVVEKVAAELRAAKLRARHPSPPEVDVADRPPPSGRPLGRSGPVATAPPPPPVPPPFPPPLPPSLPDLGDAGPVDSTFRL